MSRGIYSLLRYKLGSSFESLLCSQQSHSSLASHYLLVTNGSKLKIIIIDLHRIIVNYLHKWKEGKKARSPRTTQICHQTLLQENILWNMFLVNNIAFCRCARSKIAAVFSSFKFQFAPNADIFWLYWFTTGDVFSYGRKVLSTFLFCANFIVSIFSIRFVDGDPNQCYWLVHWFHCCSTIT